MLDDLMRSACPIVFDMDGVLVDSEKWHRLAYLTAFKHVLPPAIKIFDKVAWHGRTTLDVVEEVFSYVYKPRSEGISTMVQKDLIKFTVTCKQETYRDYVSNDSVRLFPWVAEVIHRLHAASVPIGVVTGSDKATADKLLQKISRKLDKVVTRDSGMLNPKPSPDMFLYLFDTQHWNPLKAIVIEDSKTGLQAAVAAGAGRVMHVDIFKELYV